MDKIILLDWGGPVVNNRTWKMPGSVDPVVIKLLNDLTIHGWQTVFISEMRSSFKSDDPRKEALEFFASVGFYPQFYKEWSLGDPVWGARHIQVAQWMQSTDLPENAVFLVIDDDGYPQEFLTRGRIAHLRGTSSDGLSYLEILEGYALAEADSARLEERFAVSESDDAIVECDDDSDDSDEVGDW